MPITTQERKYLKNKHKGGKNNNKGATYENYYATYLIASFTHKYMTQMESVFLSSQLENAFVDDLLVNETSTLLRTYHQLKDVARLTWRTGKGCSLETDFKRQMEISNEKGENFKLKLIYSKTDSPVSSVPNNLSPFTTSEYFPASHSINQLILSYPPFKDAIKQIMVQQEVPDDELSGAASAILGAWNSVNQNNVSLQNISDIVYSKGKGYVNIKTYPTVTVSYRCKEILNQFGLTFRENGLKIYWFYGNLQGEVIWTANTEQRLVDGNPTDIWSLIELLS